MNRHNITAVIIAGGKGSRFEGKDKGLLEFKQKPIIKQILDHITPQVDHVLINANRNQKRYAAWGFLVIKDDIPGFNGPLAGLLSAMSHATTADIVTLPCDAPFLCDDYVSRMLQIRHDTHAEIVVAHDGKRMQPMYALIPTSLRKDLKKYLLGGHHATHAWYRQHDYVLADFSDVPEIFSNINSKLELQQLETKK